MEAPSTRETSSTMEYAPNLSCGAVVTIDLKPIDWIAARTYIRAAS